ncbi:MAG TPA: YebC/PmpR family DNA-binding transcriptional regulator [Halothiobacillus sp.]|nr:MAG: YebC/PmpR family DNA-binding transcriptional regulator [Halothiobacillus sp. 20-54-6]HQT43405.1 YebC/PmpR family DNA-binding transcriptional regulator [Halothiobacillus sp.]
MGRAYQNRKQSMAKTADAKTKVYSRYGREIYVCAKSGGTDPSGNLSLRSMIERAKKDQVPAHVIEKAIEKAKGGVGEDFTAARYEGFGPGGCVMLVDCLTDNPNRTIGDVRNCFTKTKCKLGTPGTVMHQFDHAAIFAFDGTEDAALEALLTDDVDVTEIESEDGKVTVFVPNSEYNKARQALVNAFGEIEFEVDEIQFVPKGSTPLTGDDIATMEKLIEMLNDVEDVQNIYHDAEY